MSKYKITGIDRNGKRFRLFYDCRITTLSINLWHGTVWKMRENGKWKRIAGAYEGWRFFY